MDDKMVWTDTVSAFALHDVEMPEVLQRFCGDTSMWGHLRSSALYFLRYQQGQHTQAHIERAQDELLRYGRLAQETWNMEELLTSNLHTCMLHVPEQVQLCGEAAFSAEWWLERLMQVFKRVTKYCCTRYPETSAVQHWLTVAALDDVRLHHPKATRLLDEIRCSRSSTSHDSTLARSWLSGTVKSADSTVTAAVDAALRLVERNHDGNGMKVTRSLEADKVGCMKHNVVGPRGQGVPLVELSTAQAVYIKDGKALVRTRSRHNAKQDCYALVAYSLEEPSPAAEAVQAAALASQAVSDWTGVLTGEANIPSESGISAAAARNATGMAREGAEAAHFHAAMADTSAGYSTAAAALVDALNHVADGATKALGVEEGPSPVHLTQQRAALQREMWHCRQLADLLPAKCIEQADPAPASMCMLLEIEHLVRWEEVYEVDGMKRTYRLAVGNMTQLEAVSKPALGLKQCFVTEAEDEGIACQPTPRPAARSYKYAVWLDQIECAMVKADDSRGKCYYIPTNKSSSKG